MPRLQKISKTLLLGATILASNNALAGAELDAINAEVAATAEAMNTKHGILPDALERTNLKRQLIIQKVVANQKAQTDVKALAEQAFTTYEIHDESEQRKLIIGIEAALAVNGAGVEPIKENDTSKADINPSMGGNGDGVDPPITSNGIDMIPTMGGNGGGVDIPPN